MRVTLNRLSVEGLDRHDSIHAIGSVLIGHVWNLMWEGATSPDPHAPYFQALRSLTASSWRGGTGVLQKTIPPGTKLPVALTLRERDLILDTTSSDPDFAKGAVVDGTGIRMELSLDDIEEIQGHVAAAANHTHNARLRKELERLFSKLQVFLDAYDDQSE